MSTEIVKLSGAAFYLATPIGGLLVALCHDLRPPSLVVVVLYHKVSGSIISRMVSPRITQFTDLLYSHTAYDVTICFRSEVVIAEKRRKCRMQRVQVEFFQN